MKVINPPVGPPTLKQRLGMFVFPRLPITRFLFDILRDEVAAFIVRAKNNWLPWRRSRLRRLRALRDVYVNVACGPQVLPESMLCGTPVVAFRRGGVPEGIDDGRTGFNCDTIDEMCAAVGRLSQIDRAVCRSEAERRFSGRAITDDYETLYRRLAAKP